MIFALFARAHFDFLNYVVPAIVSLKQERPSKRPIKHSDKHYVNDEIDSPAIMYTTTESVVSRNWLPGQRRLIWLGAVHRFAATDPVHPASQAEGLLHSALEIPTKMQAPILPFVEERKYNDLGSAFVNEAIEKVIADRFPIDFR